MLPSEGKYLFQAACPNLVEVELQYLHLRDIELPSQRPAIDVASHATGEGDEKAFYLWRQLVCIADRPTAAIGQRLKAVLFIAIEDLVTGFSRDAELATNVRHRFSVQQSRYEP
jgi:hypothetical protein